MGAAVVDVSIARTTLATSIVETTRAVGGEERSGSAGDVGGQLGEKMTWPKF